MANYRVEVKSGKKGTAAEHCRYDARVGKHSEREDLLSFEFDNMPEFSQNHPLPFWKLADKHERKNAAAYREFIVSFPNELSIEENIALARKTAQVVAGNCPWQMALHGADTELSGIPNPHGHLMISDRAPDGLQRPPEQFFSRFNPKHPERGGCRKLSGGRTRQQMREQLIAIRQKIADLQNEALAEAGFDMRVDHRSLHERGIDRLPEKHLGPGKVRRMSREERKKYVESRNKKA